MAEVYGNIGDQPVELNNAASEATLNALLEVAKAQFNSQTKGKDARAQRDLEKKLKDLAAASVSATKTIKSEEQTRDKSVRTIRQENEARRNSIITTENLKKATVKATNQMSDMAISISRMGDSVTAATSVLTSMVKQIPLVGGAIGGLVDNVAQAIEGTQKSFMAASSIGADFGASINDMINSASSAGLTIDQFTGIISRSGENLSLLGKGTADGAKLLARFGKEIRNSPYQDQLANLGYSTEEVNESLVNYGARLRRSGMSQEQINNTLVESTADYLKNLNAVSKLTGQSRKDLEAQRSARRADSQFRAMMQGKDEDTIEAMDTMLDGLDKSQQQAFKEIAATGTAQSEAAQALFYQSPELAQNAMKVFSQLESGGQLTMGMIENMHGAAQTEAKLMMKQNKFLAKFGNETQKELALGSMNLANRSTTLAESLDQTAKTAEDTSKEFGEMSPAQLVKTQQEIAESSNEMQRSFLRASGTLLTILEKFQNGIQEAVGMLDDLSNWTEKAWKKIKEWIEIFDTEGVGGIFGRLASAIYDGMKEGVGFLIDKAIEIGEKISTGFINNLPDWLKSILQKESELERQRREDEARGRQMGAYGPGSGAFGAQAREREEAERAAVKNQPAGSIADSRARMAAEQAAAANWIDSEGGVADGIEEYTDALDKKQKEEKKAHEEQKEATEELIEATEANTKETKAASTCELDYSSPQALFNSFAKIMVGGKAGVTDAVSGTSLTQRPPSHIGGGQSAFSADIQGLSNLIYSAEGTSDERARQHGIASGYDVTYGYGKYASTDKPLSEMTVAEVKEYQKRQIAATRGKIPGTDQGTGAVGKAQITQGTLADLQKQMGFKDTDVFSPELQDQMMVKLLERSGLKDFQSGKITANQFQDRIAGTWASIGKSGTGKSAYGQPTNSGATSSIQQVLAGLKDGTQTVTPSSAQAAESASQDKSGSATPTTPGPGAPAAVSSAASGQGMQTDALNTQVAQLIASNKELVSVAHQQLRALRGMSSDGFVNA